MRLTERKFVVVSGIPGSGKSRLALQLAPLLGLAVIDKDDILERLFESRGAGDAAWRRTLSRDSDAIFQQEAEASEGALLVSHWHLPGMPADSGTPTEWLMKLSSRIVNVHCESAAEIAAARFMQRERHAGHLDQTRSREEIAASIRDLARFQPPAAGKRVTVDSSAEVSVGEVTARIFRAFDGGGSTNDRADR